MVGAGTVIADNPRLTCRASKRGRTIRCDRVIDRRLRSGSRRVAKVFHQVPVRPRFSSTTERQSCARPQALRIARIEVIAAPSAADEVALDDEIALEELMREFGRRGWCNVLIEGGAHLAGAALRAGIVDRIALFIAPMILGAGIPAIEGLQTGQTRKIGRVRNALRLENLSACRVGDDWLLEGDVRYSGRKSYRR